MVLAERARKRWIQREKVVICLYQYQIRQGESAWHSESISRDSSPEVLCLRGEVLLSAISVIRRDEAQILNE